MDFSSGNSGNSLYEAVVKFGDGCRQEGAFCRELGSAVTPHIYSLLPNGYVMEKLTPFNRRDPNLLLRIEFLLSNRVWHRPAFPVSNAFDWVDCLKDYGLKVPDWAIPTEFCLTHGDPTASNTLSRNGELILCDPRPPRNYIPQCRETDMGRILQSFMGWEMSAYGWEYIQYVPPLFIQSNSLLKKATFWCGAAAVRIEHLEKSRQFPRQSVLDWCERMRFLCLER
jgi:hypothetical protein